MVECIHVCNLLNKPVQLLRHNTLFRHTQSKFLPTESKGRKNLFLLIPAFRGTGYWRCVAAGSSLKCAHKRMTRKAKQSNVQMVLNKNGDQSMYIVHTRILFEPSGLMCVCVCGNEKGLNLNVFLSLLTNLSQGTICYTFRPTHTQQFAYYWSVLTGSVCVTCRTCMSGSRK